ncbi:MAG TPA: LuxR C-terminal-related transcriptional regulator [Actinophytocola sp.]|nr:LuxR C-terminal-related transcriptional regulator [Actinophytocola sp.]
MTEAPAHRSLPVDIADLGAVIERLLVGVRQEVMFLVPYYARTALEFSTTLVTELLRRGGRLRLVLQTDVASVPEVVEYTAWLGTRNVVPRLLDHVPVRALTIDQSIGMVFEGPTHRMMYTPSAVRSLCRFTELLWDRATPTPESVASLPTPRVERILRLLAGGLTDEAVARKIGVSVRTVRNDIASSMSEMSAQSRFQAGVHAAQLGLV